MKSFFHFILCFSFLLCSEPLVSQDKTSVQREELMSVETLKSDSILQHLKIISDIQQESKRIRDSVRADRNSRAQHGEAEKRQMADEYEAMIKIADNTQKNTLTDDWNVYGAITLFLAVIAFIVSWWSYLYTKRTYDAQLKTERHTTNAPIEVQLWKLEDLPRHFYRNLVCTCAMILKYGNGQDSEYPSESNMKKLQTLPDDVVLPIDVDTDKEDNAYKHMHELKLLLRNYNIEVEVASDHLSRQGIAAKALEQDFGNLLFKPFFLIRNTFDFKKSLQKKLTEGYKSVFVKEAISKMIHEHFKKLSIPSNFRLLFDKTTISYLSKLIQNGNVNFKAIDKHSDIQRSIDYLLGYADVSANSQASMIDRNPFIGDLPGITSVTSNDEFVQFCLEKKYFTDNEKEETIAKKLYPHLAPYFECLNQPAWSTHTIIYFILAVDAAIETNRIGMVNYK